jgi:spermidine synthase
LFLNGNLQFSSTDEYRYHEAPRPSGDAATQTIRAAVFGVRRAATGSRSVRYLKYPSVERVTLVDLESGDDEASPNRFPAARRAEKQSFSVPRVQVINEDAVSWVEQRTSLHTTRDLSTFPIQNTFALWKPTTRSVFNRAANTI